MALLEMATSGFGEEMIVNLTLRRKIQKGVGATEKWPLKEEYYINEGHQ